jgi:hypothetical protein
MEGNSRLMLSPKDRDVRAIFSSPSMGEARWGVMVSQARLMRVVSGFFLDTSAQFF